MIDQSVHSAASRAHTRRWHVGIISAFLLVAVWGLVFLSLVEQRQQAVTQIEYFVAETAAADVEDVFAIESALWRSIGSDNSLGMSEQAHWFKFELPDWVNTENQGDILLKVDYPLLDSLQIWQVAQQGNSTQILSRVELGDTLPFAQRPIEHPLFIVPLEQADNLTHIYARVKTSGTIRFPISLWRSADYISYSTTHASIMTLFFGFMVAMAISNLFFFVTTRNTTFLVYTGYVLALAITLSTLHGYSFQYLWPNNTFLQGQAVAIFASLTLCLAVVFSSQTLDVHNYSKRVATMLKWLGVVFLLFSLVSVIAPYALMIKLFMLMLLMAVFAILACGIWLSLRGNEVARYYTLAWSFLLLSGFSATLDNLNIVELPISSHYLLIFGASVETLLLGLILAMRYSQQRDRLLAAQAEALEQEQAATKAKDELIQVQQQSQDELEYKVQERTWELEVTLRELSEANAELEQLSAMDQLTGLHNRRHFDKRFLAESRRSRREQTTLAVAMLDVDHFKQVNDQYGHISGDQCLQQIANVLKSILKRPSDEVCRYGGEEFAFILPNTDEKGAAQLLETMRKAVAETSIETDDHTFSVTLSAGVTASVMNYEGQEKALLEFADGLLYEAKRQGRNQVIHRAFDPA